jgi:putative ABC transport system substrate-binding protein
MRRREFITLLGGAVCVWPLVAQAQQPTMPVIGYLNAASREANAHLVAAFKSSLADAGYVEGQNVETQYRYGDGLYDRLPELAAELVRLQVSVIVVTPTTEALKAVMAATSTIPIIFMISDDPAKLGLVASLSHPGGNATGVNFFISELTAKRLGLLHELLPAANRIGALVNPNLETTDGFISNLMAAALSIGVQIEIVHARDGGEIEMAFSALHDKVDAVMVAPDSMFVSQRAQITALASRYRTPVIYTVREYVDVGGLMSYGPSVPDMYRQLALYAGRVLKGEKPRELPVVQPTKFDLVINLKTAKALGLSIPPNLLATADEVIE